MANNYDINRNMRAKETMEKYGRRKKRMEAKLLRWFSCMRGIAKSRREKKEGASRVGDCEGCEERNSNLSHASTMAAAAPRRRYSLGAARRASWLRHRRSPPLSLLPPLVAAIPQLYSALLNHPRRPFAPLHHHHLPIL